MSFTQDYPKGTWLYVRNGQVQPVEIIRLGTDTMEDQVLVGPTALAFYDFFGRKAWHWQDVEWVPVSELRQAESIKEGDGTNA